jgi:ADP-glucose pyrophosphorylase
LLIAVVQMHMLMAVLLIAGLLHVRTGSFCPPAIVSHCELDNTLVGEGCVLRHSKLRNVVLGSNAFIDAGAHRRLPRQR